MIELVMMYVWVYLMIVQVLDESLKNNKYITTIDIYVTPVCAYYLNIYAVSIW